MVVWLRNWPRDRRVGRSGLGGQFDWGLGEIGGLGDGSIGGLDWGVRLGVRGIARVFGAWGTDFHLEPPNRGGLHP